LPRPSEGRRRHNGTPPPSFEPPALSPGEWWASTFQRVPQTAQRPPVSAKVAALNFRCCAPLPLRGVLRSRPRSRLDAQRWHREPEQPKPAPTILGLLFTFLYAALDRVQSAPFFGSGVTLENGDFLFFSFTTLTTTGYGNLVPAAQPGKMFAGLEMLMGQIFLVTLVAGLVSLWRPRALVRRREGSD
jgi:Ion channel